MLTLAMAQQPDGPSPPNYLDLAYLIIGSFVMLGIWSAYDPLDTTRAGVLMILTYFAGRAAGSYRR